MQINPVLPVRSEKGPVVCAQIGARDHYAFPRAFHREGLLRALITDYWCRPNPGLPFRPAARLAGRCHPDLADVPVFSPNFRTLLREAGYRITGVRGWEEIMRRNVAFQAQAAKVIEELARVAPSKEPGILFAYSYAAKDLFRVARQHGWKTILGQIDPGPVESRSVEQIARSWPDYPAIRPRPPEAYFAQWHEELEMADRIIVNSDWSRDALLQEGADASKLQVVPIPYEEKFPAAPPKEYPEAFSPSRPLRLLFLGQVHLRKGAAELLEAMRELESAPVELWIVGSAQIQLPEHISRLKSIHWFGQAARNKTEKFYCGADLFVFPTHSDGFGLTQLEAMSHKLPVLATTHCAHIVEEGVNGTVLEAISPAAIAATIRRILSEPGLLPKWSAACKIPESCRMDVVAASLRSCLKIGGEARCEGSY